MPQDLPPARLLTSWPHRCMMRVFSAFRRLERPIKTRNFRVEFDPYVHDNQAGFWIEPISRERVWLGLHLLLVKITRNPEQK